MTYPWSSGDVLTAADLNAYAGLVLVKTQTIGSGVSSVTVTNAFSSTFDNYRIIHHGGTASAFSNVEMTLGATATGYYWAQCFVNYSTSAVSGSSGANVAHWRVGSVQSSPNMNFVNVDVFSPNLAIETAISINPRSSGGVAGSGAGYLFDQTAYTSFTFTFPTGTATGGTIRVYGYNNG